MDICDYKFVKYLLDNGVKADPSQSVTKTSPLAYAAKKNLVNIVCLLHNKSADLQRQYGKHERTVLHIAAGKGSLEVLEYLLRKGADINATDKYGNHALAVAVIEDKLKNIKLLREYGSDITHKNNYGYSALDLADYYEYKDIISALTS